jgi:glycosyltransferase involved in cell wall biosynthesis
VYITRVARLLFVTGTPANVRGGSGTFVGISVLRRALEGLGHEVELLAPEPGRGASLPGRLLFNLQARRAARARSPDVVVGFDLDGIFLRRGSAPSIASLKGVLSDEARFERGAPRIRLTVESFFERLHARHADRVLTSSRYSAVTIARDYRIDEVRIRVVPEPIELARWKEALHSAEKLPRDPPGILCVAHLYPRKDVAGLLEAVSRIRSPAVLRVVGVGPELERLQRQASRLRLGDRVEFTGQVPYARLAAEYRRATVFCLPSRQEGFGIVFLEAMAAGLPIVAARAGALPEVLADGDCGIFVPPGDPPALTAALDGLLGNAARREALAIAGLRRVERFDAPIVAAEFLLAIGISEGQVSPA